MADFETESVLNVVVDEGSLRQARRTVEDGMSDVMVGVDASGAAGGGAGSSGVSRVLTDQRRSLDTVSGHADDLVTLAETRNDLLEELVEQTGGGGAGGSGRFPTPRLGGLGGAGLGGLGLGILGVLGLAGVASATGGEAPTIDAPDIPPLRVPDIPPLRVPEPDWAPVDVTVPDWLPLGLPEPTWLPITIPRPDWLPGEQPTPTPTPTSTPTSTTIIDTAEVAQDAFARRDTAETAQDAFAARNTHDFGAVFGDDSRAGVERPLDAAADTSGRTGAGAGPNQAFRVALAGGAMATVSRILAGGTGRGPVSTLGAPFALPAMVAAREGRRARQTDRRTWLERILGTTFGGATGTTMATGALATGIATGHAQNRLPSEKRGRDGDVNVDVTVNAEGVSERDLDRAMEQAKREVRNEFRFAWDGPGSLG